jgi:putative methionine-R-sulfoxide reductase with GAF domain
MMTNAKLNKPRSRRKFTNILATSVAVLVSVFVIIFAVFAYYNTYTAYQQGLTIQQQLVAQDAGKTVSTFLQGKFSALETALEYANPVLADSVTRKNILESLLGLDPAFQQFALLDRQGRQLSQATRVSQSLTPQFILQLNGDLLSQTVDGQRYFGPAYIDDATSEPLVVIAVPVTNILGDYQATLAAEVNLKFMWDLVDQLKIGETGYAYIVDSQGNLLAFQDTSRVLAGENAQQISVVSQFIGNPSSPTDVTPGITSYQGLTGTTVLGTYVPLGSPQWAVVTELPTAEAFQPLVQLSLIYVIAVLAFTILGALMGFLLARQLAAPVVALSAVASEVAEGNLQVEAKVSGAAEVAQVATTFNTMTARLREMIGSLEQRVAARTKDLETVAEVGTATATILESKRLLQEVVDLTKERFNLYHSHIYLLDEEGKNLVLTAGAGEPGRVMVAEGRSISLDREQSLVARAARERQGVTVNDVTQAPDFLPNPLLPDTRSELAVPMIAGDNVIGVFDIQSEQIGRFTESDVNIQTTLAAQLAVSIQNVRSFERSKKDAELQSLVNVIGSRIQSTTSIEETLQTAIRELGTAIGASRVKAKIQPESKAVSTELTSAD